MGPIALAVFLLLLSIIVVAALVVVNLNRNRQGIFNHWYAVGYRDAELGTMWYSIQQQQTPSVVNAYMSGFTDYKKANQWVS